MHLYWNIVLVLLSFTMSYSFIIFRKFFICSISCSLQLMHFAINHHQTKLISLDLSLTSIDPDRITCFDCIVAGIVFSPRASRDHQDCIQCGLLPKIIDSVEHCATIVQFAARGRRVSETRLHIAGPKIHNPSYVLLKVEDPLQFHVRSSREPLLRGFDIHKDVLAHPYCLIVRE